MKLYTTIPSSLKAYFNAEIEAYKYELNNNHLEKAWLHLERAHILGQKYPFAHSYVHWLMLLYGFKIKNAKEVIGQIPRLLFGGVKSFVGKVPVGNPGGSNVPPLKAFPIDSELYHILERTGCTN